MKYFTLLFFGLMRTIAAQANNDSLTFNSGTVTYSDDAIIKETYPSMPDSMRLMSTLFLSNKLSPEIKITQRPFYNHSFRFATGYSLNTTRIDRSMKHYNDTSEHSFTVLNHSPIFSLGQTFALDSTFSLGYNFGYANSEIYYDQSYYGSQFFYLSLNPQLYLLRSYNFEYYVKLKIGVSYEKNNLDDVPSERIQNLYPTGLHMFTGFSAGINYLINDNLALNVECAIWSPETINAGISYRFLKQSKKDIQRDLSYSY